MTKIGAADTPAEEPNLETYKTELDKSSKKFLQALEQYNRSNSSKEQEHLQSLMDQQMAVIQSAIKELSQHGLHKEGVIVVKDYMDYKDEKTEENYTCLHNDMTTLRDSL
ncbi:MAG TPA: hypothetical protein VLE95_04005 [Chlamydiales bacterium]|nr:hypothetical protein [Chlamydiales bacterium]